MADVTYQNSYDNFLNKNTLNDLNDGTISNVNNKSVIDGAIELGQTSIGIIGKNEDIKSANYSKDVQGWKIDGEGNVEFNNGKFRGDLSAATINIPNSTSPLFSVDASGNVVASSLKRRDFNWFTLFESIDGYLQAGTPVVLNPGSIELHANNSDTYILKGNSYNDDLIWDKRRSFRTSCFIPNTTDQEIWIICGDIRSNPVNRSMGFYIENGDLYGYNANGTTLRKTFLTTITGISSLYLECVLNPGLLITFYVNGVALAASNASIPTGAPSANIMMEVYLLATTTSDRTVDIGWWEFWQAN